MNNGKHLKRTEFLFIMLIGFIGELIGAPMVEAKPVFYILFGTSIALTIALVFCNNHIYKYHGYFAATVSLVLLSLLCYYGNRFQSAHVTLFTYICFCTFFRQLSVNIYAMGLITILEFIIYFVFGRNLLDSGFSHFSTYVLPLYFAQFYLILVLKNFQKREKIYEQKNESSEELLKVVNMKKAETEEANRTKTEFLANMSHEIRTPINSILGFNELILREAQETDKNYNKIIQYSENALQSGKTLLSLINDILDFSKIESGKTELLPEKYELCSMLEDMTTMMRQRATSKNLEFITEISDDIPHILYGDKKRISQIILNILSNAVKYTVTGSVTFTVYATPHIHTNNELNVTEYDLSDASLSASDKKAIDLHVVVKDTGIGIKLNDLSKLFDEFERFDAKKNKGIEGTGLGLMITKFWTDRMGGSIDVQSKYEIGSTFTVIIPQIVLSSETISEYREEYNKTIKESAVYKEKFIAPDAKILVVDDNEMNLSVFSELLKKTKIQVDTALSGKECLALIKQKEYDLIFMDHMMPVMNGIETLHKMRKSTNHLCKNTPVISLTANAISGMRTFYLSEGFADYISKPIDPTILEQIIMKNLPHDLLKKSDENLVKEVNAKSEIMSSDKTNDSNSEKFAVLEAMGIDLKQGMLYAGEDEENYLFNLLSFTKAAQKAIKKLEEFKANSDLPSYAVQVHSLKGNLRTIGAAAVSNLAFEHEKYAKSNTDMDYINKTFDELKEKVEKICSVITDMNIEID